MNYLPVSDTIRILTAPGTRAQLTLLLPLMNYKDKQNQILNPDGSFNHWATDGERFDRHVDDVLAKLAKCTGKHRRINVRGGDGRKYPIHGEHMTTAWYVARYRELNGSKLTQDWNAPLSTRTQEWPADPIEESIDA